MNVFFDTSAIVKLFSVEPGTEEVEDIGFRVKPA